MELTDFFNFHLTGNQKEAIKKIDAFLGDDSFCFLLKGYAGTGKTFLIKGLSDFLANRKTQFVLMAPTGRAAMVIANKTKRNASTIHKAIYAMSDLLEYTDKDDEGNETFKFFYPLKNNYDNDDTIYIVDESSMISNNFSAAEFFRFGSGFLLKDLIHYVGSTPAIKRKIIFIGDPAQLPPVSSNNSPALDKSYLEKEFGIKSKEYELTEVFRHGTNSGILDNATKIRESIKQNIYNQIEIQSATDVIPVIHEKILEQYLNATNNIIDDETTIIAYSNRAVKFYNEMIRKHFFAGNRKICIGDKIMIVHNNYANGIVLLNGDFGIVLKVDNPEPTRFIKLGRKSAEIVSLNFINLVIRFQDVDGIIHDLNCKAFEDLLYSTERDLSSAQMRALLIDFNERNKNLKHKTPEYKQALKVDPYFNCLRLKFGYAITCHKAQGGEWKNAFVDFSTSMGYFNSSYFHWAYTALTRAKEKLFTINEPHLGIGSLLKPSAVAYSREKDNAIVLQSELEEIDIPFSFPDNDIFLKNIYLAIFDIIKNETIEVVNIVHNSYQEKYYFSREHVVIWFNISYNAHHKITSIQFGSVKYELTFHCCN
ncbi:MAG: AAA family ATPase [Ignavibacteriales bacterium]|nr:AAA family ATPase [Ignavibacteriales bacterium]